MLPYALAPENLVFRVTKNDADVRAVAFTVEHKNPAKLIVTPILSQRAATCKEAGPCKIEVSQRIQEHPMRTSQFFFTTLKEAPADAEVISQKMMLRAGYIKRVAAGIYTWMPLGLRVLRKVENIVREEMNNAGALEC
jgi:hypothetical protein